MLALFVATTVTTTVWADGRLASLIQTGQPVDRNQALALIASGADVNATQPDGTAPLHWAVHRVDYELVERLLAAGADPNVRNLFGATPLVEAVRTADLRTIDLLIEAGASPDGANHDGQTALMVAMRLGRMPVVERLLQHGADVNAREEWRGQTVLMWAVAAGTNSMPLIRLLIEHGADVNARAYHVDWERQISGEPRAQYRPTGGLTPLLYATRVRCLQCAIALVEAGADVNMPNPDGTTPLINAIENHAFDLARYLLEQGANPHVWDWWGRTALYAAVNIHYVSGPSNDQTSPLDIVQLLLAAGVNPNPQLNQHRPARGGNSGRFADNLLQTGTTPLLRAASMRDATLVAELLNAGADPNLANAMGITPLMVAAGMESGGNNNDQTQNQAIAVLNLLLAAGADVDIEVTGITSRSARIARSLDLANREGQTALQGAASRNWGLVVDFLNTGTQDAN